MNITLTGFMGTGKTEAGREVARRLGWPFVDMDAESEKRAGKSISRIFAEDGELAFRQIEAQLVRELTFSEAGSFREGQKDLVIATGGGTLVNPDNRRRMLASGPVFCLTADADTLLQRLALAQDRPLLDVIDRRAEIERLLQVRREAYAAIPRQVDTAGLRADEIAERVIAEAFSILLPVRYPGGSYPVHIGRGLLRRLGELIKPLTRGGSAVAVVTNPTVGERYLPAVLEALRRAGLSPFPCTMPDGESYKTLDTLAGLYDQFVSGDLDRSSVVLALGGGVVCDVGGFAAATYMRGLPIVQVPTTLLAMVDASVGGKTAVDLPQGKNLVGAFKQPTLVAIDPDVLATLPQAEIASGMAELIKHGILADAELFQEIVGHASSVPPWERWIARSLQVKIDIVEQDPLERGIRAVLNLGHTTAHGLEQLSNYTMRHGEAVSIGMVAAARIAVKLSIADATLPEQVARALTAHGLPTHCPPFEAQAIWEAAGRDKKKQGKTLRWVLPKRIGQVEIVENIPQGVVLDVLRKMK